MEEKELDFTESFERASADLEILRAAYPDEIVCQLTTNEGNGVDNQVVHQTEEEDVEQHLPSSFPLIFTLKLAHPHLNNDNNHGQEQQTEKSQTKIYATITMEFPKGYPMNKSLQVLSYRSSNAISKEIIEEVVLSVKQTALEAFDIYGDGGGDGGGEECGLSCCATAIETWTDLLEQQEQEERMRNDAKELQQQQDYEQRGNDDDIQWITSEEILMDRKSAFQAHLCIISSEDMVKRAVDKLLLGNTKLQRATHNMVSWKYIVEFFYCITFSVMRLIIIDFFIESLRIDLLKVLTMTRLS